ncbi:MAG: MaoC family dehydratase [Gammaproteobacteria bacterium]
MSTDRNGYYYEDLEIGQSSSYAKTVTDADIVLFAGVSGDTNPVHLDDEFASTTRFGHRIAHGMLTAAFISTVLGTKLPGPGAIYLKQNLKFMAPVKVGDTVVATATIEELNPKHNRAALKTVVTVGEEVVVDGDAMVYVPSRASE